MSSVCCPNCWTWSELGTRTSCKKCGSPLVMASGQPVAEALGSAPPPPPPPPPPGFAQPAYAVAAPGFAGPSAYAAPPSAAQPAAGHDWVAVVRIMTVASGALGAVLLLLAGLAIRHDTFTTTDPRTGLPAVLNLDLGPVLAVAAVVVLLVSAAVTWGLGNRTFRIVWLCLSALSMVQTVATLGKLASSSGASTAFAVSIGSIGYRAVYLVILWLSINRTQPNRLR